MRAALALFLSLAHSTGPFVAATAVISGELVIPAVVYSLYSEYWCNPDHLHGNVTVVSGACMEGHGLGDGNLAPSWKYTCLSNGRGVVPSLFSGLGCNSSDQQGRLLDTIPTDTCIRGVKFRCVTESIADADGYTATITGGSGGTSGILHLTSGICQSGAFEGSTLQQHANASFVIKCGLNSASVNTFNCLGCSCAGLTTTYANLPAALSNPAPNGTLTCSNRILGEDGGYLVPANVSQDDGLTCEAKMGIGFGVILGTLFLAIVVAIVCSWRSKDAPQNEPPKTTVAMPEPGCGEPGCTVAGVVPGPPKAPKFNRLGDDQA